MRRGTRTLHTWLWTAAMLLTLAFAGHRVFGESGSFTPYVGLPGKDVIWLPAELTMVNKMLDMAEVTSHDVVIDLGSGDGRIVIGAAKRGAQGVGVELNGELVALSKRYADREGVGGRAQFVQQDLFEFDLNRADVVTLFLLDSINLKLRPKLLELRPGTRVVSNTFTMDEWRPDKFAHDDAKPECMFNCSAYLWIVPAKAQGTWRFAEGELVLQQKFQMLDGTLASGGEVIKATGEMRGADLRVTAGGMLFVGRVNGGGIEGTRTMGGVSQPWRANRG